MTVKGVITSTIGHLAPHVSIIEDGSGALYSGPITTIPEHLNNREYISMVYASKENIIIFRVKGCCDE